MKVKQVKEFNPITITLETEEEADKIYKFLNTDTSTLGYKMWAELNMVYCPKEYQEKR